MSRREAEPRTAPRRHMELLDAVAGRIAPDDPDLAEWYARYSQQHRRRLAMDLLLVEEALEEGSRVLECGAVPPLLTACLTERGYAVQAVDLAPERFAGAIAGEGLDVRRCDIEREPLPFEAETFDAVLFNEVFEHLRIDLIFTLEEVHRVLRPGGRLLLSTPNLRSLRGLRNLLTRHQAHAVSGGVYEQYDKLRRLGHMGHVREYTVREVSDFLARLGLRSERVIFRGGHGRGLVGLAERLAPSLRPFFSLLAVKATPEG